MSKELVIVGGGITGLVAAYLAAKEGRKVTVLEGSAQFGGLLNTFKVGPTQLEYYYHHFFTHDAELNWLLTELNLNKKLFFQKSTMGVYKHGVIYPFNSPMDLLRFRPLNILDKVRFGITSIYLGRFAEWRRSEGISCSEWLRKWAGKNVTESIWMPLLKIKFGIHAPSIPLSWLVGRMHQRLSSRKSGSEQLGYLQGSLQVLLDTLLERLKTMEVDLRLKSPVTGIVFKGDKISSILTDHGKITSDQYLFTIPGVYLSQLLCVGQPSLSRRIGQVEYFGAVCVVLEMTKPLGSVYWLNVAEENFPFGGIIEHTNFIPPSTYGNRYIAYLSRYYSREEDIARMTDNEITDLMLPYVQKIYRDFDRKSLLKVSVFRTSTAATVCDERFSEKVPNCKSEIENLFIVNMSHVYPDERSVNNSIRIACEAATAMGIPSQYVPRNNSLAGQIGF